MPTTIYIDAGEESAEIPKKGVGRALIEGVRRPELLRRLTPDEFDRLRAGEYAVLSRGVPLYFTIKPDPPPGPWRLYVMPRPPGRVKIILEGKDEDLTDDSVNRTWKRAVSVDAT